MLQISWDTVPKGNTSSSKIIAIFSNRSLQEKETVHLLSSAGSLRETSKSATILSLSPQSSADHKSSESR
jgi:hypothetical protein